MCLLLLRGSASFLALLRVGRLPCWQRHMRPTPCQLWSDKLVIHLPQSILWVLHLLARCVKLALCIHLFPGVSVVHTRAKRHGWSNDAPQGKGSGWRGRVGHFW